MTDNNTNSKMRKHIQTQAGAAIEVATGTALGGAIAATTAGGVLIAATPVAVGVAVAYGVGSFISSLFDD